MELNDFLRSVVRRWYIVLVLLVAALVGTWLYHSVTSQTKATATVVILRAYVAAPGEYIPPQLTFDTLDESRELALRVADRLGDGTAAESLQGQIDIGLRVSNTPTLTPLYDVSFSDPDEERALHIAGIVLEESLVMYEEVNRPTEKDLRAAFAAEVERATGDVERARATLAGFERENAAFNLTARRDQIRGYLGQLRLMQLQQGSGATGSLLAAARADLDRLTGLEAEYTRLKTEADLAQVELFRLDGRVSDLMLARPSGDEIDHFLDEAQARLADAEARYDRAQEALASFRSTHGVSDVSASRQAQLTLVNQLSMAETSSASGAGSIAAAIEAEEAELQRLDALAPEYERLSVELGRAEAQLSALESRILDIVGARALPSESQTLVLDAPRVQPNILWFVITYALAIVLAGATAFTVIYLLAIFEHRPYADSEIEAALGLAVLAHVSETRREGVES